MKRFLLCIALYALCLAQTSWAQTPDWENPQVIGIHKLPYHATLQLPSKESACKEIVSLDGQWSFHWSRNPEERPVDFYKTDYDVTGWGKIAVPGNWQTQGYGMPIYTNMNYPFKRDEPRVTSEPPKDWFAYENRNPVGSYVTQIKVTQDMLSQNLILHFGGVHSAMYVWINGEKVGYSQNSMSPAEFDVSSYLHEGNNKLAVEVYRWCDGSYLEDQDMWRLSGIFRPVQLWVRPLVHIADYKLSADPKNLQGEGFFQAEVKVCNTGKSVAKDVPVSVKIGGKTLEKRIKQIMPGDTVKTTLSTHISSVHLWSAHDPYLYPVSIETGKEHFDYHIGFKKVEVLGEILKINGKTAKLRGVNRHDHHPRTGRYVDRETYDKDITMMKQANINFLRTSHYPDDPYLYELCDRYGIFVMDEANQESHGYGIGNKQIGDNPNWTKAHVDRAVSLVERDKNHPSIIMWSLGNEGGAGRNFKAMREAVLSLDTTRVVFSDSDRSQSDIYDDSYLLPDVLAREAQKVSDKPFMMREYAHAMGNSMGGLKEYWDVIYADSSICGVAIWDWVDQGLSVSNANGKTKMENYGSNLSNKADEHWAYGGDFGDKPNDNHFCLNGLLNPDRTPHPHYYEVQHAYRPIRFAYLFNKVWKISNDPFVNVNDFDYTEEKNTVNGETLINVQAMLKEDKPWAKKGTVVSYDQFVVGEYDYPTSLELGKKTPKAVSKEGVITVTATRKSHGEKENVMLTFDARNGALTSYIVGSDHLLKTPLEPYFWKPLNDNQRANGYARRLGDWKECAEKRELKQFHMEKSKGRITLCYEFSLPVGADYTLTYTINQDGELLVEADYKPLKDDIQLMPKFGMRTAVETISPEGASIRWYGRGPEENYPDRKLSQPIGEYSKLLTDFQTEYINPQDNSNRCDVRWFSLDTPEHRLTFRGLQPLCLRANNYDDKVLDKDPMHPFEIKRDRSVVQGSNGQKTIHETAYLNIDLNVHGVGGADGWGAKTFPAYTNPGNEPYHYGFIIQPSQR